MFTALITLLTALSISVIAAYVSVTGMMAIFPAAASVVMYLMASLEVGKLVGASWLKLNWKNPALNPLHKGLLTATVVVLMGITSLGMYGFLSKGYLEQSTPVAGTELQIKQKEQSLKMLEMDNDRLQKKLDQLDANIAAFLKGDKAERANAVLTRQKQERTAIEKELKDNNDKVRKLNEEILPLKLSTSEVEAKLGPIKYVAALFGWQDPSVAVRMVIMMLIFVSDPLAVQLLLAAQISFLEYLSKRSSQKEHNHEEHSSSEESHKAAEPSSEHDNENFHQDVLDHIKNAPDEEILQHLEHPVLPEELTPFAGGISAPSQEVPFSTDEPMDLTTLDFELPDDPLVHTVTVNNDSVHPVSLQLNAEQEAVVERMNEATKKARKRGAQKVSAYALDKAEAETGITKTRVKGARKRKEMVPVVPTPEEAVEAYQSSLKRLADAYQGRELTVQPSTDDKQKFIEILENRPELLGTLIDVIREGDRTDVKVQVPEAELPSVNGGNPNAVTSDVPQEQISRNLTKGWLRKPQ